MDGDEDEEEEETTLLSMAAELSLKERFITDEEIEEVAVVKGDDETLDCC